MSEPETIEISVDEYRRLRSESEALRQEISRLRMLIWRMAEMIAAYKRQG